MSLDKAIKHGKEHRKPYFGGKAFARSCRNHGICQFCKGNRLHKFRDKHPQTMDDAIDAMTEFHERSCPDCGNNLYIVRNDSNGRQIYICACCGLKMWNEEDSTDDN